MEKFQDVRGVCGVSPADSAGKPRSSYRTGRQRIALPVRSKSIAESTVARITLTPYQCSVVLRDFPNRMFALARRLFGAAAVRSARSGALIASAETDAAHCGRWVGLKRAVGIVDRAGSRNDHFQRER